MGKRLALLAISALVLSSGAWAWGPIYTDAYARVDSPTGTKVSEQHTNQTGWQHCYSHASATNGDGSTQAWANASATPTWQGLNSWTSGGKITAQGDFATWSASQGYNFWISVGGFGNSVLGSLQLGTIRLVTPAVAEFNPDENTAIDLSLLVGGVSVGMGSFTLFGNGSSIGSGWYVDSFFDVFYESATDCWVAEYTGPSSYQVEMPVGMDFWLEINDGSSGSSWQSGSDDGTYHEVNLLLPEDYEFVAVPEPASIMSLLMGSAGLALMLRRKR